MTPQPQKEYIADPDSLAALADYFNAAINGHEDKSKLNRLWDTQMKIILSRQSKDALTDAYREGYNDGHDANIVESKEIEFVAKKNEREKVCKKIMDSLDNDNFYAGSRWKYQEVIISVRKEQ